jgi:chromosomal replication initiator protein
MVSSKTNSSAASSGSSEPLVLVKENQLARASLLRLGESAGNHPPLVFLHGPAGVGKSHLLRHFVREARRESQRLRVHCTTASEFVGKVSEACDHDEQAELQSRCTAVDLFILEDLSAIEGHRAAQRMLVPLLDDLRRAGGRVIVTCSCLPGELKDTLPRLASRLHGGICVAMELLTEPSRLSIAKRLAASRQIPLSSQAADLLAKEGPATPREILAALINLDLESRRNGRSPDASMVRAQLKSAQPAADRSLARIAKAVAKAFGVPLSQLRSTARLKSSVLPRQIAMLLARELSGRSAGKIAAYFGRKNHTTVVHACRRCRALIAADPGLSRDVERIRRSLRAR